MICPFSRLQGDVVPAEQLRDTVYHMDIWIDSIHPFLIESFTGQMGSQETLGCPSLVSELQESLDHRGKLHGKLIQIGDVQEAVPVDPLDVGLYR